MKWWLMRLDYLVWLLRRSDGFDDRDLLIHTAFWLAFGAIVIVAFALGLAKVGL